MDVGSIQDYINETMATSVPTLFVSSGVHWSTVQQTLKTLKINTLSVEGIHKKKFIYGSKSSFNRAINYFEEENKQFIRRKIRLQIKDTEKDESEYVVGNDELRGISKSRAKIYLQESEKIQLFLLGSFLSQVDRNFFRFESEKEKDHFAKKFKLFNINFEHEINKRPIRSQYDPKDIYSIEQRPLTELLLSEHRSKLESTGLRLYLYSFNEMHGDTFLFLNTILIPPPRKCEYVDHVYILRHMAMEASWKKIEFNIYDQKISAGIKEGLGNIFIRDFLSFGTSIHNFNEYKVFGWVKENREKLLMDTNLSLPKELLPDFEYAYGFERYRKVLDHDEMEDGKLEDDAFAKEEKEQLNRVIDRELEDGSYDVESAIEDENARESDAFMGPDIPESIVYEQISEEDEIPNDLLEGAINSADKENSKWEKKSIGTAPVAKISDAEIVDFFHRLDNKQIGILKKLIDISKK